VTDQQTQQLTFDGTAPEGFPGKKAAEIVGISYRQLDYWARTDLIRPSLTDASGSGSRRSYSYRDLLELKVIKRLLDGGVKLEQVRQAFRYIRDQLGEDVASANIILSGSGTVVVQSDDELVDAVKNGQGVLNLILAVGPLKEELDASVVQLRGAHDGGSAGKQAEVV
jgi:DNA-binding transcriptional MerR regulator